MNAWKRLAALLEEERQAIVRGDFVGLMDCVKRKQALLGDPSLKEPAPREIVEEVRRLAEHNRRLLEEGLAFIDEAYRFLSSQMGQKTGYTPKGEARRGAGGRLIDFQV